MHVMRYARYIVCLMSNGQPMTNPSSASTSATMCTHLAGCRIEDISSEVIRSMHRGILDWLGCALAGSDHTSLQPLLTVLKQFSGRPDATVFGNKLKLGIMEAAVANGYMGHVLDFDDTHLGGTILHASSPVLAALFALADSQRISGPDFLLGYLCGFEAGIRCGQASPGHHKGGWHLTGTLGCLAAGVATAKVLGLDPRCLNHALGIAATQAAGMQQNRGTMCKYLHAGKAASAGLLSGLLAQQGFDSAPDIIEGEQGFSVIYSDTSVPDALLHELGTQWEISRNGYKPYASAAVLHPIVDAMREVRASALASSSLIDPASVDTIELTLSPYAMSIAGVRAPESGMQSKFSVFHTAAVALLDGDGGVAQYSDQRVRDPAVFALRDKVRVTTVETLLKDQCEARVVIAGIPHRSIVEHATGTVDNPIDDATLASKFFANTERIIGRAKAQRVLELVHEVENIADMSELSSLCA